MDRTKKSDQNITQIQYRSLNDAVKGTELGGLSRGDTEIWYWKPEFFTKFIMGSKFLTDEELPTCQVSILFPTFSGLIF